MKRLIYLAVATTLFATGVLADKPSVRPTPRPRPLPGGQHLFASVAGGRVDEFARNRMQFTFASGLRSPRYQNLDVGSSTNVDVTGLSANTNYYYRVGSYDGHGISPNSKVISVKTARR